MTHPDSPHEAARRLVDALLEERISPAVFDEGVTEIQRRLEAGFAELEALLPDDDCPDGVEIVSAAAETLRAAWQALEALRALVTADSEDAPPETAALPTSDSALETDCDPFREAVDDALETDRDPFREAVDDVLEQICQATTRMAELAEVTRQQSEALETAPEDLLDGMFG